MLRGQRGPGTRTWDGRDFEPTTCEASVPPLSYHDARLQTNLLSEAAVCMYVKYEEGYQLSEEVRLLCDDFIADKRLRKVMNVNPW